MLYDIWLTKVKGIGCHTQRKLLNHFETAEHIYHATLEELMKVKGLGKAKCQLILEARSLHQAEKIMRDCERYGIGMMNLQSEYYPEHAKKFDNMPTLLYYRGNPREIIKSAGIVGSRRCTQGGKNRTVELVDNLLNQNPETVIVSGMAKGIDSYAHTACIRAGGYTIAVLGNGLDQCYPVEHKKLWERIIEEGMLISEYEPGIPASRYHFPLRNRIIAAFSQELYVPEISAKSGAEYTIDYAREYGRRIYDSWDTILVKQFRCW